MASRWIKAATSKSDRKNGPGSFRKIGRGASTAHSEPDADDQDSRDPKKKKKPNFIEAMNEPEAY